MDLKKTRKNKIVLSKFRLWVLVPLIISLILMCSAIILYFKPGELFSEGTPFVFKLFFSLFFFYFFAVMFFGEVRSKAISVVIESQSFTKRSYVGMGVKRKVFFDELDGYMISNLSSKGETYEYFYLLKKGKKNLKISEFYHANYLDLKYSFISKGIKNLGVENWSLIRETIEIFK